MDTSVMNTYVCVPGILSILQEDTHPVREIPMVYRTMLELDIRSAISCDKFTEARDLVLPVLMLNVVYSILDRDTSQTNDFLHRLKYGGPRATDILFWSRVRTRTDRVYVTISSSY